MLLPLSATCIMLPCIFQDTLINYIALPIFFFFGSYFFFLNFPNIGEVLHKRPLYIEDLVMDKGNSIDEYFKVSHGVIMNFILAMLFAVFSEYLIVQGINDKHIVEVMAVVGGNMILYVKIQNAVGKLLLVTCHYLKRKREAAQILKLQDIEMTHSELENI
jgi:hypothetical protein